MRYLEHANASYVLANDASSDAVHSVIRNLKSLDFAHEDLIHSSTFFSYSHSDPIAASVYNLFIFSSL